MKTENVCSRFMNLRITRDVTTVRLLVVCRGGHGMEGVVRASLDNLQPCIMDMRGKNKANTT